MGKIRVFISSSLTELESEREIAKKTISQLNLEPRMFENLPAMNKPLENAYIDEIKKSHIFVLILWKDLTVAVEKEYNVAVKYGLPTLILVKIPTFRETRTPRLDSLINVAAQPAIAGSGLPFPFRKNFRKLAELEQVLKEGIMTLVSDRFTEPVLTTTNIDTICEINQNMVQNAGKRLLLVTKTPMLLLGPKPYDSVHKKHTSNLFYQTLTSWIETMKTDKNRKMLYLYSVEDTRKEIKDNNLEKTVEDNLKKYKKIEDETEGRFQLCSLREFPGRIHVSDNSFGIQFRALKEKVVYIHREDAAISSKLFEVYCGYCRITDSSLTTLQKELKLLQT
jgi:hypothetical protein